MTIQEWYQQLGGDFAKVETQLPSGKLTELLRPESNGVPGDAAFILNEVKQDYESTVGALRACLD